jgi:hypothetical protein
LSLDSCSDSIETVICNRHKSSKTSSQINPVRISQALILPANHTAPVLQKIEMLIINQDGVASSLSEGGDILTREGLTVEGFVEGSVMDKIVEMGVDVSSIEASPILGKQVHTHGFEYFLPNCMHIFIFLNLYTDVHLSYLNIQTYFLSPICSR